MSLLVDDIVVFPSEAEPKAAEASLSDAGLSIIGASFGESVLKGTQVKTSVGSVLIDREPETRTIALRLRVREEEAFSLPEAAARLEAIVGEMQQRDSWIRRDFHVGGEFGSILYHVTGEVTLGEFAGWQVGDSPDVSLNLVCDFAGYSTEEEGYGPFVSADGDRQLVYELPANPGTTKGLRAVHVTNDGPRDWRGLIWSEECRSYKPGDPTALPHYEAVDLTPKGGSALVGSPPEVRAVGAVATATGAISPALPAGTQTGDLLIMVAESGGPTTSTEASTALTALGWSSPPTPYVSPVKGNTRLTLLYRIATGIDPTTTNDTGDHQAAAIIGIKAGTFDELNPFNVAAVGTQAATKSVSAPGATTTRNNCLVIACASANLPDAGTVGEFSAPANGFLHETTERIDSTFATGDGGALWAVTGVKYTKGAYGATTCTAVTEAERAAASVAVNPPEVVAHSSLTGGKLVILSSEIAGVGHMTHRGPRKIWMRLEQPAGAVGDVKLRLLWRTLGASRWVEDNEIVSPYVIGTGNACLLDFGVCRPEEAVLGGERWEWVLQAWAPSGSGSIRVRDVYALSTEQYLEVALPGVAQTADLQVTKSPGAAENDPAENEGPYGPSERAWSNPGNASVSDDSYASVALEVASKKFYSQWLRVHSFGFTLPGDAEVVEIVAEIECQASVAGSCNLLVATTTAGYWFGEGEEVGFSGVLGTSDQVVQVGLPPISAPLVNGANFGVAIQAFSPTKTLTARVDCVRIGVYYAEAEDQDRLCFASRGVQLGSGGVIRQHKTDDVWGRLVPNGLLPSPWTGASRGVLIASQGDLAGLPDLGVNPLSATARSRAGLLYARESS